MLVNTIRSARVRAALQPFHEQLGPLAVVPDHFQKIAATSAKNEKIAVVGIAF